MPRKSKIIKKDEGKMLSEKKVLSQEEANTLEQMLDEDDEKTSPEETKQFIKQQRIETTLSSPSLEKINAPQKNTVRLETNLKQGMVLPTETNGGEDDSFKYIPNGNTGNEKKYIQYEGPMIEGIIVPKNEIINIKSISPLERREVRFENSPQAKMNIQDNFEKYSPVARVDKENMGKEKPFQRKEIKYTPGGY